MKKLLILLTAIIFVSLFFTSCKKGEEDPAISLLSRKARLTGTWELKTGDIYNSASFSYDKKSFKEIFPAIFVKPHLKNNSKDSYSYSDHISFDNGSYTYTYSNNQDESETYSGNYSYQLKFNKDNSFRIESRFYDDSNDYKAIYRGIWSFLDAAEQAQAKNKQRVYLEINNVYYKSQYIYDGQTYTYEDSLSINSNSPYVLMGDNYYFSVDVESSFIFYLKRLANNEIIIDLNTKTNYTNGYSQETGELTFNKSK